MMEDGNSPALKQGVDFRGTPNEVTKVTEYVRPGKKRAPFLRYIKINLPRTTRALLVLVIGGLGVAAAATALGDREPFPIADILLWLVAAAAVVFVAVGAFTRAKVWGFGTVIAVAALLIYLGGLLGDAPYAWNGASLVAAATWNLVLLLSAGYLVLYWALRYGMLVAYPDNQNFMD